MCPHLSRCLPTRTKLSFTPSHRFSTPPLPPPSPSNTHDAHSNEQHHARRALLAATRARATQRALGGSAAAAATTTTHNDNDNDSRLAGPAFTEVAFTTALDGSVAAAAAAAPRAETAPEEAALTTALETGEDRASGPNCGRWCSGPTCGWRGCRLGKCHRKSCKVCPVGKTQTVQNPVVRMCVCACVNFCVCVFAPTQSQSGHNEEERGRRGGAK